MSRHPANDIYSDFAEFYDLYVGDWIEDLPLCLEYARVAKKPVLEIGAGSGRLTIPIARAGVSVVGIDVSASMLARLEARLAQEPEDVRLRVRAIQADMGTLNLGTQHDVILVPFYAFNYLLSRDMQRQALKRLAGHLVPDGRLIIDVFIPHSLIEHCPAEPILKVNRPDPRTGDPVRGWVVYTIDVPHQIETRRHIFDVTRPDGSVIHREFTTTRRYAYPGELVELFKATGFRIEEVFTGYQKHPPTLTSSQLVYVLTPAAQ